MTQLAVPTVHLNGTSKSELQKQIMDVCLALDQAEAVMCAAAPHSRDYYVQSDYAYGTARTQHYNRLVTLQGIKKEYEQIWENLEEQNDKK